MSTKIKALVVDDSPVFRTLWSKVLKDSNLIDIDATAENGAVALEKIKASKPDLVLLDIEMPVMNGLETLERIKKDYSDIKVIIASSLSLPSSEMSIKCLTLGASDYITKPSHADLDASAKILIEKIQSLFKKQTPKQIKLSTHQVLMKKLEIIAIGSSTGGPNALTLLLKNLSPEITAPILITQHMPPVFTKSLADRLQKDSGRKTVEASSGMKIEKNTVYIAPGDYHMVASTFAGSYTLTTNQNPPENFCRPAVDPMFRSIADLVGPNALTIILTGMGQDGMLGAKVLKAKGAPIIAQDEKSSVVWGMPGAVVLAELANHVLPISDIAQSILDYSRKYK